MDLVSGARRVVVAMEAVRAATSAPLFIDAPPGVSA
jgi:hypothetical protein